MAGPLPSVPRNFMVQPGNGLVYLSWDLVPAATSYVVLRSTDNITFSTLDTVIAINHTDDTGTVGMLYWYAVQAVNANGTSSACASQSATVVDYGKVSLGQVRLAAQQRADMVNNNFVSTQEWNSYINHSYAELYDVLVSTYGDEYFVADPYTFTTDGRYPALYPLPTDLYKLLGVDLAISAASNGWLTLKKFAFISRNRYIYGSTPVSFLGVLNLRYRMVGSNIEFVPIPQGNQAVRLWYVPRPAVLLADSDLLDGISGFDEYVIVDAAIKALQKEESDVTILLAQKQALFKRIETMAAKRDIGQPEVVTDIRRLDGGYFSDPFSDGPTGGW